MIRYGLCCIFRNEPIRFRRTTAAHMQKSKRPRQLGYLAEICLHNARSLRAALHFCHENGIGDFRVNSQILPLRTHPAVGYAIEALPGYRKILEVFESCRSYCREHNLRTSFHPDPFILLSSPDPVVIKRSVADLVYQAEVSRWIGADVINIHAGGVYGDKKKALSRLAGEIEKLPAAVRSRLTIENDDRSYTPTDLIPLCRALEVPLVYDVHHHRCLPDGLRVEEATDGALTTWNREPLFHLSSPLNGWQDKDRFKHHDFIDIHDFPGYWQSLAVTVEIEAKAKELAVIKLMRAMQELLKPRPETVADRQ